MNVFLGDNTAMTKPTRLILAILLCLSLPQSLLKGQESGGLLGPAFESPTAGIALRRPANCREILKTGGEIVEFVNDEQNLQLRVSRTILRDPTPLTASKDNAGRETPGMLESTADRFKTANIGARVLRQDVVNIADANVGMLAVRYNSGARQKLMQQALIAANDRLYYVLTLTTPASRNDQPDDGEKQAVELFGQILDSVRLIDTAPIRADQEARLYRTRGFLVNLTENRIKGAMLPEQWIRLVRNGKDIGYTYVAEEIDNTRPGGAGLLVSVRARTVPAAGLQADVGSQLYVSFDRRHETWASVTETQKGKDKSYASEFGSSDRLTSRVLDRSRLTGEKTGDTRDEKQPPVRQVETYTLNVTNVSKTSSGEPIVRQLPPWYLPQALGHLLPRLVPLDEPKTYMFSSYVSDRREVMSRYIDVGEEQNVTLAGTRHRAIPVKDRIGLEGAVTVHYMSPSGRYLGSQTTYLENDQTTTLLMLPSDEATLKKLWANARLTRPGKEELRHPGRAE